MNPFNETAHSLSILENFVNNNPNGGGVAEINEDYISRPNFDKFLAVINNNLPVSALDGFNNDCL